MGARAPGAGERHDAVRGIRFLPIADRRGQSARHGAVRIRAEAAPQAEVVVPVASESAVASLEIRPPARIAVGRGTAFVIGGYCYHPNERTHALEVLIGDSRQPVERF